MLLQYVMSTFALLCVLDAYKCIPAYASAFFLSVTSRIIDICIYDTLCSVLYVLLVCVLFHISCVYLMNCFLFDRVSDKITCFKSTKSRQAGNTNSADMINYNKIE